MMRGRRLLLVLAVFGLFAAGFTGTVAADAALSVTGTSVPDTVTQGDSFDLTVSVSGEELQNDEVDVSLTLPDGLSCSPSGTQTVTLSGGTGKTTFDCTANAEDDYAGEITVTATATNVNSGNSLSDSTQTGLSVQSPASLSLTTSLGSTSVGVGESTTLTAVVQNTGDASTSYTFSASGPSGVSTSIASGSASGTVSGTSAGSIEYTLTGNSDGSHDVTVSVSGGNGQSLSETVTLTVDDTTAPTADAGSSLSVDKGSTFTFDGTASSDNDAISTHEWDADGDGAYEKTGAQPSHSYASTGDKTVTLRVTDAAGNTATDSVTVSVQSTDGGTGGGSRSSEPAGTTVSSVRKTDGVTAATIDRVTLDDPTVTVETGDVSAGSLSVESASATFDLGTNQDNEMRVQATGSPPDGVPAFDAGEDRSLGHVTVGIDGNLDDHVTGGSFVVNLDRQVLSNVDPEDVTARRYHDGEWQTVETRVAGNAAVKIVAPGYSTFAITAASEETTPTGTTTEPTDTTTEPTDTTTEPTDDTTAGPSDTTTEPTDETTEPTDTATGATTAAPTTPDETATSGAGSPGFGIVGALAAFVALLSLAKRRDV